MPTAEGLSPQGLFVSESNTFHQDAIVGSIAHAARKTKVLRTEVSRICRHVEPYRINCSNRRGYAKQVRSVSNPIFRFDVGHRSPLEMTRDNLIVVCGQRHSLFRGGTAVVWMVERLGPLLDQDYWEGFS